MEVENTKISNDKHKSIETEEKKGHGYVKCIPYWTGIQQQMKPGPYKDLQFSRVSWIN